MVVGIIIGHCNHHLHKIDTDRQLAKLGLPAGRRDQAACGLKLCGHVRGQGQNFVFSIYVTLP